ncbi:MAG: hypothetical protein JJE39_06475 [Vicinamibacteria bacterium]|nr:hypothetical protein [Vicinamibacteria bacterium]
MRVEEVAAERAKEVRDAARAWRRAGFIDEDTLSRIVTLYPDERRRFGLGFRVLAFVFTSVAVWAIVGLSFVLFDPRLDSAGIFLFWAIALTALTEVQRGPLARTNGGAETATALIAVLLGIVGGVIAFGGPTLHGLVVRILASAFVLCAAGAWRWGDRLFFLGAGLSGFGLLVQTDQGRLLCIVAALLLIPACFSAARGIEHAPAHRRGAIILGAVAILALYAAIHIWSWDQRLIEGMGEFSSSETTVAPPFRWLSILATALLPAGFLAMGWRRREPLLLYAGLILTGLSVATIRLYHSVMPLSLALILIGAVCLGLGLWARRWLRAGEKGERAGFTADPLFDNSNRTDVIKSVVAMASFTPSAQATPARNAFEGGGGRFGGGGATGGF